MSPEFLSGIIAGISHGAVGHPLDTLKVLQQNKISLKFFKFKDFLKGFKYPIYYNIFTKSLCFDLDKRIKIDNDFIRNAIVGLYLTPFTHYIDINKINIQTNNMKKLSLFDYINYRRYFCTVSRDMIAYSLYIPIYKKMKENNYNNIISAASAGIINWTASYPLDVIRTRQFINNNNTLYQSIQMGSLWSGYTACASRSILTTIVSFSTYEYFMKKLK